MRSFLEKYEKVEQKISTFLSPYWTELQRAELSKELHRESRRTGIGGCPETRLQEAFRNEAVDSFCVTAWEIEILLQEFEKSWG
jgi:hypothetical protein